jgi:hypothetical protein
MKSKKMKLSFAVIVSLMTIASCKKEAVVEPTAETGCSTCLCNEFDSTGISQSVTVGAYGSVFYYQAYTSMVGKYVDYSMNMSGTGNIDVIPLDAIWQAENSNFTGEILRFTDASVKFDYSAYSSASKTVSFDANQDLGDYTFKIDGSDYSAPSNGVSVNVTNLTNGKHIEVSGTFTTIELGGWELVIDNMCTGDYLPQSVCEEFEDTSFTSICSSAQTSYGSSFYASNGVSFRCKYVDYEGISSLDGSAYWGAPNIYGVDENINFNQQLLQVNNIDLELDFSTLNYTNKRLSFDISNVWDINDANEFIVNGSPLNTVPAGVTYNITSLGNANNGSLCYHVEIEGPINTIVLVGWEITYDNLCIQQL